MDIVNELTRLGAADVGFANVKYNDKLINCVSFIVRLSDAVVDEITDQPTYTYFHHYRTVNTLIDQIALQLGILLAKKGYDYICVPASQTVSGHDSFCGLFSHKEAAVKAGLGYIGKNNLFISNKFGPRVRLGAVFTDYQLEAKQFEYENLCGECDLCVKACPANALSGENYQPNLNNRILDPHACSSYMKDKFQLIGRGSVCGICMKVCPKGQGK